MAVAHWYVFVQIKRIIWLKGSRLRLNLLHGGWCSYRNQALQSPFITLWLYGHKVLKIFLTSLVQTDMTWHWFLYVFFFKVPPLHLRNSDNVRMQKHRHLLCFCIRALSELQSTSRMKDEYCCSTVFICLTFRRAKCSAHFLWCKGNFERWDVQWSEWDSGFDRCLPRDMAFIDACPPLGLTDILQLGYLLILNCCVSFCLRCRVRLSSYGSLNAYNKVYRNVMLTSKHNWYTHPVNKYTWSAECVVCTQNAENKKIAFFS